MEIYIHINGLEHGPFTVADVTAMYIAGSVRPSAYAYVSGDSDYRLLGDIVPPPRSVGSPIPHRVEPKQRRKRMGCLGLIVLHALIFVVLPVMTVKILSSDSRTDAPKATVAIEIPNEPTLEPTPEPTTSISTRAGTERAKPEPPAPPAPPNIEDVLANRHYIPDLVILKVMQQVPIFQDGVEAGIIGINKGSEVSLDKIAPDGELSLNYNNMKFTAPHEDTDLLDYARKKQMAEWKITIAKWEAEQARIAAVEQREKRVEEIKKRKKEKAALLIQQKAIFEKEFEEEVSIWDGSHRGFVKSYKQMLRDPGSFEHVKTVHWYNDQGARIRMTYRGRNELGVMVTDNVLAQVNYDGSFELIDSK